MRALHPFSPDGAAAIAAHWFLRPDLGRDRRAPANGNHQGPPPRAKLWLWGRPDRLWGSTRGEPENGRSENDAGKRFEVTSGGVRLAAWEWGPPNAPTVVLAHGWNGRGRQLAAIARAIAARGYRAVTFDQPGHGASGGRLASIPRMAEAISAVSEATGGAEAVVAHSLGAVAATYALSRGLGARRAVFIAPPVSPARWIDHFSRIVGLPEESRAQLLRNVEVRAGVPAAELDPLRLAPALGAALLVVHDDGDQEVPLAAGVALADAWPGARLLVTSGLGHNRLLADREVIAAIVDAAAPEQRVAAPAPIELREPHLAAVAEAVAF